MALRTKIQIVILFALIAALLSAFSLLPAVKAFIFEFAPGENRLAEYVSVPGKLNMRVVQQPAGRPDFISIEDGVATQYSFAASAGTVGLLAHNTAAGADFSKLTYGDRVNLLFSDGTKRVYKIARIMKYQALQPQDQMSPFYDQQSGTTISALDLFKRVYMIGDKVTFQTCIARDGNDSWGRLFVIAEPLENQAIPALR